MADLEKHAKRARIALVGHEPGIGELAARLIGSRHPIPFKKGAICRIDVEGLPPTGPGDLRWFLTPRILQEHPKVREMQQMQNANLHSAIGILHF